MVPCYKAYWCGYGRLEKRVHTTGPIRSSSTTLVSVETRNFGGLAWVTGACWVGGTTGAGGIYLDPTGAGSSSHAGVEGFTLGLGAGVVIGLLVVAIGGLYVEVDMLYSGIRIIITILRWMTHRSVAGFSPHRRFRGSPQSVDIWLSDRCIRCPNRGDRPRSASLFVVDRVF